MRYFELVTVNENEDSRPNSEEPIRLPSGQTAPHINDILSHPEFADVKPFKNPVLAALKKSFPDIQGKDADHLRISIVQEIKRRETEEDQRSVAAFWASPAGQQLRAERDAEAAANKAKAKAASECGISNIWRKDKRETVEKWVRYGDADMARYEAISATLEAVVRIAKSIGFTLRHSSSSSGRADSRYFVIEQGGRKYEARVSDHYIPYNTQRFDREMNGGGPRWGEIVIGTTELKWTRDDWVKELRYAAGLDVVAHEDARVPARWYGDKRHAEEISAAIDSSKYAHHALRVMTPHPKTSDDEVEVGHILSPSHVWDDGEPTEHELDGTSGIGVDDPADIPHGIKLTSSYFGKKIALIGAHRAEYGHDKGERVLHRPEVLAVWHRKRDGVGRELRDVGHADYSDEAAPTEAQLAGKLRQGAGDLPMDTASRMKRAQELGFTVRAYHGTGQKFNEFDLEKGHPNPISGYAPHFSISKKEAQGYADEANNERFKEKRSDGSGDVRVLDCLLRVRNPYIASYDNAISLKEYEKIVGRPPIDRSALNTFRALRELGTIFGYERDQYKDRRMQWTLTYKRLIELGYDAIYFPGTPADYSKADYTKIVVFDPKNVRSVNAKFDPAQSVSSNLLA